MEVGEDAEFMYWYVDGEKEFSKPTAEGRAYAVVFAHAYWVKLQQFGVTIEDHVKRNGLTVVDRIDIDYSEQREIYFKNSSG